MYFGESEKRTDSLEVKGEGTAKARGDSSVSGSYDRRWCCSFMRRASLERKLFGGSTCFFFFFGPRCHYFALTFEGQFLWVYRCELAGYSLPCFDMWSHCSLPSIASVGQPAVSGFFCWGCCISPTALRYFFGLFSLPLVLHCIRFSCRVQRGFSWNWSLWESVVVVLFGRVVTRLTLKLDLEKS